MNKYLYKISDFMGSKRFFWLIIGFFIFESAWIAFSAVYPQAFDEGFHFGLIQVYSHYWLPFLSHQPANANAYGAVAVDPSYLYHYLLSFPLRLINLFTHRQTTQVILFRFINIGFFAAGLVLFRKILLRVMVSNSLANVCLAIFVLIPIVPQLAAHINYDNLVFLLLAWVTLITFGIIDEIRKRQLKISSFLTLFSVCIFTSLVKDTFLPIFLGIILFLAYLIYKNYRHKLYLFFTSLWVSWQKLGWLRQVIFGIIFIVALGMFAQRDISNLVSYHALEPNCSAVLNVNDCSYFGVWAYSYNSHQAVLTSKNKITYLNPIYYFGVWLYWMWYRLFFAVNGPASHFTNYPPLPLPCIAAVLIGIAGVILVIKYRQKIFRNTYLSFLLVICTFYIISLLGDGYAQYRYTNELVTMNGRYLIPVLLFFGAIIASAFSLALRKLKIRKTIIALVVLLLFLQGGGFLTFISRSDSTWDWSNPLVVKVNNAARKITKPIIVKGSKTYTTKYWIPN